MFVVEFFVNDWVNDKMNAKQLAPGTYKTRCGYKAIVSKLKQAGRTEWFFVGAIEMGNLLATHVWLLNGESGSGRPDLGIELEKPEPTPSPQNVFFLV